MNDPFSAVTEATATGEIADLFADIRTTVGVRVVNLVWRHLATLEGALPWAWSAVKLALPAGNGRRSRHPVSEGMILPRLEGVAGDQPASVDAVLASYDHSNTINLFSLAHSPPGCAAKRRQSESPPPVRVWRRRMSLCRNSRRRKM